MDGNFHATILDASENTASEKKKNTFFFFHCRVFAIGERACRARAKAGQVVFIATEISRARPAQRKIRTIPSIYYLLLQL